MRKTQQIRISKELHKKIKLLSFEKNTTISKLADKILEEFVSNYCSKTENYRNPEK